MKARSVIKLMQFPLFMFFLGGASFSQASPGSDVATMMEFWYRFTARDCGSGNPASNCSGIILRGVDSTGIFRPWNAGPNSHNMDAGGNGKASIGGVSVSYLRQDAEYDGLGLLKYNGFALTPNDFVNSRTQFKIKVLCAFPIDAWTGLRSNKGCGDFLVGTDTLGVVEDYCQKLNIRNATEWMNHYKRKTSDPDQMKAHQFQCGFDITADYFTTFNKGDAFNAFIESRKRLATDNEEKDDAKVTQTELRLETWPDDDYWKRDWTLPRANFDTPLPQDTDPLLAANRVFLQLPIAAFIYIGGIDFVDTDANSFQGRTLALKDQLRWSKEIPSGQGSWKPVIKVQLPRTIDEDAKFAFYSKEQAVPEPVDARSCDKYIERYEWTDNYVEPVLGTISSLKVTPTECGRSAGVGKTDVVYAELANIAARDMSKEWNFDHMGSSMRRQLACHLDSPDIAMNKATWSLEPKRPYVAHDVIMKLDGDNKCNPH